MDQTSRRAACGCGQLSLDVRGEPLRVSVCHCLACQRRTGSAFGVQARFPREAVTIVGQSREFARVGDDGGTGRCHFCPTCGATVFYRFDDRPEVVAVPVGAFADSGFPPPRVSVYEDRQHPWVRLCGEIEHVA